MQEFRDWLASAVRLGRRVYYETERAMARLPALVVLAAATAIAGAAWSLSHETAEVVRHGRVFVVPSFWDAMLGALFGAFAGLLVVLLPVAVFRLRRYLRLRGLDEWLTTAQVASCLTFYFERRPGAIPAAFDQHGLISCEVRTPHGETLTPDLDLQAGLVSGRPYPLSSKHALLATIEQTPPEWGTYEITWFGSRKRLYPVARAFFDVHEGDKRVIGTAHRRSR